MGPYLIVARERHAPLGRDGADQRSQIGPDGWIIRLSTAYTRVLAPEPSLSLLHRADRRAVILGDVFSRDIGARTQERFDTTVGRDGPATALAILKSLWGRYILIALGPEGDLQGLFRDPSGSLECLQWRSGARVVASSDLETCLPRFPAKGLGIDWSAVGAQLADPGALALGSSLIGVSALAPGAYRQISGHQELQLWKPADHARRPMLDPTAGARALEGAVDHAVSCLAGGRKVAAEVSGGFDSATVAAALYQTDARCVGWFHRQPEEPDADERMYAQALADKLGVHLDVSPLPDLMLDLEDIAANQTGAVPSVSNFDPVAEDLVIALCRQRGAEALFTGMGGDAVYWTAPTPIILSDRLARVGIAGAFQDQSVALARWVRTSLVGAVLTAGRMARLPLQPVYTSPPWLAKLATVHGHPWLNDLEHIPSGKCMQIQALALMQVALGVTRRRKALDLVHPLLSQPVLEACLPIPLDILVHGGRDRGLAREAFRRRLPDLVLQRRSKGDTSQRVAKSLSNGLHRVRALLLDGRLVQEGLIDADTLAANLSEDALAQGADLLALYRAVAVELWVRHWEARLSAGPGGA